MVRPAATRWLSERELRAKGFLHRSHVGAGEYAHLVDEPLLACCGELVRHRFPLLSAQKHACLARIQSADVAREWTDLDAIQVMV